jgi:tripartite-type tricarboxylate transporter receptor subunit TctC
MRESPEMKRLVQTIGIACTLAAAALGGSAYAQTPAPWPSKPIKWIVPFPPGGAMDSIARALGDHASKKLGQPVVIENKPGAGGNIGTDAVAKSPADGHTWLITSIGMVTNKYLYPKLSYDPQKDFVPITVIAVVPNVLVVNPQKLKVSSVKDVIALASAKPDSLTYASAGNGTSIHLAGELFASISKTSMIHVPYKGSGPAVSDLLGGQVDMMFDSISSARPHIAAGKLKALAVTTKNRSSALPETPTIEQAGLSGYELSPWFALFAPSGTPPDVVKLIHSVVLEGLASADLKARLAALGAEPIGLSPELSAEYVRKEDSRWASIIKERNIQAD